MPWRQTFRDVTQSTACERIPTFHPLSYYFNNSSQKNKNESRELSGIRENSECFLIVKITFSKMLRVLFVILQCKRHYQKENIDNYFQDTRVNV